MCHVCRAMVLLLLLPRVATMLSFLRMTSVMKSDSFAKPTANDVPGQTFPSRIFWTPWLGSKWKGNLYDYKGAFFQDVMYSNVKPFREGCLLFSDAATSEQMSLLYQRYAKFDPTTYAVPNATYFNVLGDASLRLGRYQIPLAEQADLLVQVPLTFGQLKEYLNAPSIAKWFFNAQMQRDRERTRSLHLPLHQIQPNSTFLRDAIFELEYGRNAAASWLLQNNKGAVCCLPILPYGLSEDDENVTTSVELGLVVSLELANSQYFLETVIQAILNHFQHQGVASTVFVSGDEHCMSTWASEVTARMASANDAKKIIVHIADGADAASTSISALDSAAWPALAFLWTMTTEPETLGRTRNFGLQLLVRPQHGTTLEPVTREIWSRILSATATTATIKICL